VSSLNVALHPGQMEVYKDNHRFRILVCGRRWGKTLLSSYLVILAALNKPDGMYWLVSPNYTQTKIIWRMIRKNIPKDHVKRVMEGELFIELHNGSMIFAKSGDNPDALRGEGLDGVVVDEAAFVKRDVWEQALRPALADKEGWALIISTPKGKNWLYEIFLRGIDVANHPDYSSFHYTSYDNPFLRKEELDEMVKGLPELTYKQEILAEFIEGGGTVFHNVDSVCICHQEEPKNDRIYCMGVDLGRHNDFTVISVGDIQDRRQVYRERFNREDWDYISDRIRSVYLHYNSALIYIDSTGMGDPIYEELAKDGLNVHGVNLNVKTKPAMVENLQLMMETNRIQLSSDDNLKMELSAYTYTILPTGNVRYEAPGGFHDDEVVSVCLMAWAMGGGNDNIIGCMDSDEKDTENEYGWDIKDEDKEFIDWEDDDSFQIGT
jgi:phage FluMu gp28-like protein